MIKKMIFSGIILLALSGCSSHPTSMQDVNVYCRSLSSPAFCNDQDSVCAKYSETMLAQYKSAKECRQACEGVRMKTDLNMIQQECREIMEKVEGRCTEFCNANYSD
ncbi:hypothetical protein [Maridesulfovibrio sp.]|uniref:hypothetical protein n=1 Tax=Maridesulfovibrio sp. TaxID=2795000 RepID=UPI0029F553CF|nr:hypothetical protein [Maridesulfovibrio sp.]